MSFYLTKSDGSRTLFPSLPSDAYFLGGYQKKEEAGRLYKMHLDSTGGTCLAPLYHEAKPEQFITIPERAGKMVHEIGRELAEREVFSALIRIKTT